MLGIAGVALVGLVAAVAIAARPSASAGACHAAIDRGVIPPWARTGFSDKEPRMPHVVARGGRLAALLFGDPLTSPPRPDVSNKILWVSRTPQNAPSDLRLSAQRMEGDRADGNPVSRTVAGGPGPSIIDLPQAGCWRITARWAGQQDELDLVYAPPSGR